MLTRSLGSRQSALASVVKHRRLIATSPTRNGPNSDDQESKVFDLAVIGGGSGGLACAKEAADLGARVCVFDYVSPSPTRGTVWGLGGTCVNVGCIPKKLMHLAAVHGEALRDAGAYGWQLPGGETPPKHDWSALSQAVRQHVKSLNFGHRGQLMQRGVEYYNLMARFEATAPAHAGSYHTISGVNPSNQRGSPPPRTVRAANVVIAVGGRPTLPAKVAGAAEHAITSDDLFWLAEPPGRTLVIGGGYVGLECAGFLAGLGHPAEVMVRSDVCLRGFDRQMAGAVTDYMQEHCGVRFHLGCSPTKVEKLTGGQQGGRQQLRVEWRCGGGESSSGTGGSGVYDTVLFATGRHPVTGALNLPAVGVSTDKEGRVIGGVEGEAERTVARGVFAIGDALKGGIELTPVAVQAGKLLARRLFCSRQHQLRRQGQTLAMMKYDNVATTVFTPLEYACVGLSEEAALARFGGGKAVEIFHAVYTPYEFVLPHRDQSQCWVKAVCGPAASQSQSNDDDDGSRRLLGLHVTGPNAGEIVQGFAALMRTASATFSDLTSTVGIHPTSAEEVTRLWISRSSGLSPKLTGC